MESLPYLCRYSRTGAGLSSISSTGLFLSDGLSDEWPFAYSLSLSPVALI
jgi:hypothetical protein